MKIFMKILLVFCLMTTTASWGQASKTLKNKEIKQLVTDKRVMLSTFYGSFPLRYRSNRKVFGDGSALGLARFFAPKETGKWWVANNRLCQKWPSWYDGKSLCFTISMLGPQKIRWVRQDGYSGTATVSQ